MMKGVTSVLIENNNCPRNGRPEGLPSSPSPGVGLARLPIPTWYVQFKGIIDCCLAVILLIVLAPAMALAAMLVKLTSRGPVFYAQTRLGRGGRYYKLYKFRTMIHNCERLTGPQWARPGDPRITTLGRILRRTHVDELPQLWNVIRGEMSLVGPRPERPEFLASLEQAIPRYRERLLVRPGLTGLAQVQLPADTDIESVRRKLARDLHYLENLGPGMDLRILLSTACYLLGCPRSVYRKLCCLPTAQTVECVYQTLTVEAEPVPGFEPVG